MVETLPGRLQQAAAAPLSHHEFLELLVDDELARRADRLFERRLKQGGIVVMKELSDFDFTFNPKIPKHKLLDLATGRFVAAHGNVLLIGPPGTGKTHVTPAFADRTELIGADSRQVFPQSAVNHVHVAEGGGISPVVRETHDARPEPHDHVAADVVSIF
jgi:hypothetical protein